MRNKKNYLYIASIELFLIALVLITLLLSNLDITTPRVEFISLNIILLLYILYNIYRTFRVEGGRFFSSILFVFYIFHFVLPYVFSNLVLVNGYSLPFTSIEYLVKAEYIAIVSCIFFTWGYKSTLNKFISNILNTIFPYRRLFNQDKNTIKLNTSITMVFLIISSTIYLFAIQAGILGYTRSTDLSSLSGNFKFQQLFLLIKDMLLIAFYALYIEFRMGNKSLPIKLLLFLNTILIVGLGLLNGMKVELIAPFIFLIFIDKLMGFKLNKKVIIIIPLLLLFSLQVMDTYRTVMRSGSDLSRIVLITEAISSDNTNSNTNYLEKIGERVNQTEAASQILYYGDNIGVDSNDPEFTKDLIIMTFAFMIPRAIYPEKPVNTYGLWVTQDVYGYNVFSSSYITIEGYLYLAGGIIAVSLVMFIIGILSKQCTLFFNYNYASNYITPILMISYILILRKVFFEPADPIAVLVGILRYSLIYPIIISMFYIKKNKDKSVF